MKSNIEKNNLEDDWNLYRSLVLFNISKTSLKQKEKYLQYLLLKLDNQLFDFVNKQGLAPIFYWNIRLFETTIPSELFNKLKQCYFQNFNRNTFLISKFHELFKHDKLKNFEIILLKGIDLCQSIYKNIGLRILSDIDILVREKDLFEIDNIIQDLGFNRKPFHSEYFKKHYTLYKHWPSLSKGDFKIDIHVLIDDMDISEIWNSKVHYENNFNLLNPILKLNFLGNHLIADIENKKAQSKHIIDIVELSDQYKINLVNAENESIKKLHSSLFSKKYNDNPTNYSHFLRFGLDKKNQFSKTDSLFLFNILKSKKSIFIKCTLILHWLFPAKEFLMSDSSVKSKNYLFLILLRLFKKIAAVLKKQKG